MITEWFKKFFAWHTKVMTYLFGPSWKTSLYGILAVLPQCEQAVENLMETEGIPAVWMNVVTIFFAVITVMNAKDSQVYGGTIKQGDTQ